MRPRTRCYRLILGLLTFGLLIGVALTTNQAQAVDAPGPFYAEPAWDQKLPAATRFLVLTNWNNEAVLDKETGLVWERSPALTTHTWSEARFQCTGRTTGNRHGWRLPAIHELASLIHPSVAPPGPTLQPGHPFLTVQSADYWSATSSPEFATSAWGVFFRIASVFTADKPFSKHIWCVRGGMQADQY